LSVSHVFFVFFLFLIGSKLFHHYLLDASHVKFGDVFVLRKLLSKFITVLLHLLSLFSERLRSSLQRFHYLFMLVRQIVHVLFVLGLIRNIRRGVCFPQVMRVALQTLLVPDKVCPGEHYFGREVLNRIKFIGIGHGRVRVWV